MAKKPRDQKIVEKLIKERAALLGLTSPYAESTDPKMIALRAENHRLENINQRILSRYVERHVICSLCSTISYLHAVMAAGNPDGDALSEDDLMDVSINRATEEEAGFEHGFRVVETPSGDYVWYESGDPVPYGELPPKGFSLHQDSAFLWYAREDAMYTDDEDEKEEIANGDINTFDTEKEAVADAWDRTGLETFSDEEEAWADCVESNRIETSEHDRESYEYWAVDRWFGARLKEVGETVVEILDFTVWGRCTTGQMISMDGCIHEVADKNEVLAGQQYSWYEKGDG